MYLFQAFTHLSLHLLSLFKELGPLHSASHTHLHSEKVQLQRPWWCYTYLLAQGVE